MTRTGSLMTRSINVLLLVLMTLTTLFSCTLDADAARKATEREMSSRVARLIDQQMTQLMSDSVAQLLSPQDMAELRAVTDPVRGLDGRGVVARMLEEEDGQAYLEYTYTIATSSDMDEILSSARPLMSSDEYEKLEDQVDDIRERSARMFDEQSRAMSTEQQKKFYKELQSLVVKAVVLLTAAVVYALIPKVVVWGKVSAACVAAVAAGVLASGVMTFVGYKNYGGGDFDFVSWLQSVVEDSYAKWAIAASVIATASAAGRSPLMTALILVALAAYQVFDEAQDMYKIVMKK